MQYVRIGARDGDIVRPPPRGWHANNANAAKGTGNCATSRPRPVTESGFKGRGELRKPPSPRTKPTPRGSDQYDLGNPSDWWDT
ncbi:hypothetical protein GCM10010388_44340 [Streptomyces mauvecolor]